MAIQNAISNQILTTTGTPTFTSVAPGNFLLSGNTIASTNANGNILIAPNGTGALNLTGTATNPILSGIPTQTTSTTQAAIAIGTFANSISGSIIYGVKSRSTTPGSFSIITGTDALLNLYGFGDDGVAYIGGSLIRQRVAGTVSAGILPTQIDFYTTPLTGTMALGMTLSHAAVLNANNIYAGYATTATAAGTTTLTVYSLGQQYFTGVTTQTVVMPVTSTLALGQQYKIVNNSTGVVTVQSSGANTIQAMAAGTTLTVTCIAITGTTASSWNAEYKSASAVGVINSGTANQLTYYAGTGTTLSGLTSANNGLLVTSAGGVPSIANTVGASISVTGTVTGTTGFTSGIAGSGTGLNTFATASSASANTYQINKSVFGNSAQTFLQITVPASPYFIGIECTIINSRVTGSSVGTSLFEKRYFSIGRNDTGFDVVLDGAGIGPDWTGTSTTAGGANNAISGVTTIARNGAEANTAPQIVDLTINPQVTAAGSGRAVIFCTIIVQGLTTGFLIA